MAKVFGRKFIGITLLLDIMMENFCTCIESSILLFDLVFTQLIFQILKINIVQQKQVLNDNESPLTFNFCTSKIAFITERRRMHF